MRKDKVEEVVEELRDQREKMVITLSHFKRKWDENWISKLAKKYYKYASNLSEIYLVCRRKSGKCRHLDLRSDIRPDPRGYPARRAYLIFICKNVKRCILNDCKRFNCFVQSTDNSLPPGTKNRLVNSNTYGSLFK